MCWGGGGVKSRGKKRGRGGKGAGEVGMGKNKQRNIFTSGLQNQLKCKNDIRSSQHVKCHSSDGSSRTSTAVVIVEEK